MNARPVVVLATTGALVTALLALVVLAVAVVVPVAPLVGPGLACLFAVPVARNVVVVARGHGAERWLALLGIMLVLAVAGAAMARTTVLDPTTPALPTSPR